MTFNTIKRNANNLEEKKSIIVMKADLEMSSDTFLEIEKSGVCREINSVCDALLNNNTEKLEKTLNKLVNNNSIKVYMHYTNMVTHILFSNLKEKQKNNLKEKDFTHFDVSDVDVDYYQNDDVFSGIEDLEDVHNMLSNLSEEEAEEKYEEIYKEKEREFLDKMIEKYGSEEAYHNRHENYRKEKSKKIIEKIKKSSMNVDFLSEIEEVRKVSENIVNKMDLKKISDIIVDNYKIAFSKNKENLLIGDKQAILQTGLNLQKCAVVKTSRDDYIYIRDKFKIVSPLIVNSLNIQKQIFTSENPNIIEEYYLLTELKSFNEFVRRNKNNVNNYQNWNLNGKKKKEKNDLIDNLKYKNIDTSFETLSLINNYLSLNEGVVVDFSNRNSVVNYDIQNIKNLISEFSNNQDYSGNKIVQQNSSELFIISNQQLKDMMINANKVDGGNIDLSFINNCSKIIANSMSLSLYDFVCHDDVLSKFIDKEKLLKNIINYGQNNILYEEEERPNTEEDIPFIFYNKVIDFFQQYLSNIKIKEILEKEIEEKNKSKKKKDKNNNDDDDDVNLDLNNMMLDELLKGRMREEVLLDELGKNGQKEVITKRRKL